MGGAYRLDGDRLVATQLATTDMACDQPLMAQDEWVADLLNGATITLDGDNLTLAKNGVRVTFLDRRTAEPDEPLLGTAWIVDTILSGDVASSVPVGARASLTFSAGRVDVETGCNTGSGKVTISNDSIVIDAMILTQRACDADRTALEQAVTATLTGTVGYRIEANALTLTNGGHGLRLVAPTR
jgi:heat shock protein HslJ